MQRTRRQDHLVPEAQEEFRVPVSYIQSNEPYPAVQRDRSFFLHTEREQVFESEDSIAELLTACGSCGGRGMNDGAKCEFCEGYGWVAGPPFDQLKAVEETPNEA